MPRSIPKKTMVDKWMEEKALAEGLGGLLGIDLKPLLEAARQAKFKKYKYVPGEVSYKPRLFKKPREWGYVTKPFFKKIKEPLFDVFKEADEVDIIIDLGSFDRSEVFYGLKGNTYTITGKHQDYEFKEEIPLPMRVDINRMEEHYKNNILELVLPRKRENKVKIKKKPKGKVSKKSKKRRGK